MNGENPSVRSRPPLAGRREDHSVRELSPAQIRSAPHQFFPEVVRPLLEEHEHRLPEILTPLDVETVWRVPRSSQKKQRALGTFVPHFRVGRRVYYRRAAVEQWIAQQERASQGGGHA